MKPVFFAVLFASTLFMAPGCKKDVDNPEEDGAHNAITTFSIKFSQGGVLKYEAVFDDPDGPGGANPVRFDEIVLAPAQTYQATITCTNKLKSPPEDMTAVIRNAGHQHLFFFTPTGINGLSITLTDQDRIGLPIGLESNWITPGTAQSGTLRVNLRHIAAGKTASSPSTAGHSDLMIDFVMKVQ